MRGNVKKKRMEIAGTDVIIFRVQDKTQASFEAAQRLSRATEALCLVIGQHDKIEQFPLKEQLYLYAAMQRRLLRAGLIMQRDTLDLTQRGKETANAEPAADESKLWQPGDKA